MPPRRLGRRELLLGGAGLLGACGAAPSPSLRLPPTKQGPTTKQERPFFVQSGDVDATSAVLWARAGQPAGRLCIDITEASDPRFSRARRVLGPPATQDTDLTAQVLVTGLPAGSDLLYRATFGEGSTSFAEGRLRTAPEDDREVVLAWSGDTVGQGWGIDPARGGLASYRAMREARPDVFVHVGDLIYADGPLEDRVKLPDGTFWNNLVVPAKRHVAESLQDFRDAFAYPSNCEHFRDFARDVPIYAIWDDHEVWNDFWPGQIAEDPRFVERRADVLSARAFRAMHEHVPFRPSPTLYRKVRWGAGAELFLMDGRSHRSPDGSNDEPGGSSFFGAAQLDWLIQGLTTSRATWKIVATDMPIGLVLPHAYANGGVPVSFDGIAQSDGPPLGRELELAKVLAACRAADVKNLLFLTADVHYAALHRFDPSRAVYKDFAPFHECVAGPLHASSFPPKKTDNTFGTEVLFQVEEPLSSGSGPAADRQSFGLVRVAKGSHEVRVTFVSGSGKTLHEARLSPAKR